MKHDDGQVATPAGGSSAGGSSVRLRASSDSGDDRKAAKRARRAKQWELLSCGRHGHLTYEPTEPDLAERLRATTSQGEAWRCLRCGDYAVGEPDGRGPADEAPVPRRGAQIREVFVMRFLALERIIRALVLFAVAYGIWKFEGSRDAVQRAVDEYLPILRELSRKVNIDLTDAAPVRLITKALHTEHSTLTLVVVGVIAYGAVELAEGVGLWVMRRWGEYVAVIGTSALLPLEIYELTEKFSALKVIVLLINLALVAWLVWNKRLFGVRGGIEAFEAERQSASIMEVTRSADAQDAA